MAGGISHPSKLSDALARPDATAKGDRSHWVAVMPNPTIPLYGNISKRHGIDYTERNDSSDVMTLPPSALAHVADYFKVLSELSRLQVLCSLQSGSKNVTEIMEETGLGQANVSKHLKILAQAGIVSRTPQGVSVYYQIAEPFIFDLCELVGDRLANRLEEQSQQLKHLERLRRAAPVDGSSKKSKVKAQK